MRKDIQSLKPTTNDKQQLITFKFYANNTVSRTFSSKHTHTMDFQRVADSSCCPLALPLSFPFKTDPKQQKQSTQVESPKGACRASTLSSIKEHANLVNIWVFRHSRDRKKITLGISLNVCVCVCWMRTCGRSKAFRLILIGNDGIPTNRETRILRKQLVNIGER